MAGVGVPCDSGAVDIAYKAAGDLSNKQYYFMKLSADRTVTTCTAATDKPIGVLQNKPAAANRSAVVRVVGESYVSSDAALTAGNLIGTQDDGQADAKTPGTDTTEYVVGMVTMGTGSAGDLAVAVINCASPHRAA